MTDKKMRICFIVDGEYPFDPRVEREAKTAIKFGYETHIICKTKKRIKLEEVINEAYIHRIRLPKIIKKREFDKLMDYIIFPFYSIFKLRKLNRKKSFDVVIVANPPDNLLFILNLFSKMIGIKKVVNDFHDPFSVLVKTHFKNFALVYLARFFEKLALSTCDEAITVNEFCEEILRKNHKRRISILKNYPSSEIRVDEDKVQEIHREFGEKIAVFVGSLIDQNGVLDLVNAGISSRDVLKKEKIKILIVGGGSLFDTLKKRIDEEDAGELIRMIGKVDHEMALNYLAASNVVVIPFRDTPISRIGNPNKLFEAIYFNKPIIISNLNSFKSVGGDSFIYFEPDDHEDLAKKMISVFENIHEKYITDKINGVNDMKKDMLWEKQILTLIESVTIASVKD